MFLSITKKKLAVALCILITFAGLFLRIQKILNDDPNGGDRATHMRAVSSLIEGENPYKWTLYTYNRLDKDPGNKGYAYFPLIMYLNTVFYIIYIFATLDLNINLPLHFYWEIPGFIAFILINFFFVIFFKNKNINVMIFSVLFWTFNSLFYESQSTANYDTITITLLLWAFYYISKDSIKSSVLFTLSILFKTFPVITGIIFLLKIKNKVHLIITGAILFIFVSIPFLNDINEFLIYLQGALLIHGDRFVQGRPYLYYLSYYGRIEFFRIIPFEFYSIAAILSGWIITLILFFKFKIKDEFSLSIFPFLTFYFFTPVLNKTYLLWGIPFFLVGGYTLLYKKYPKLYYLLNIFYWIFTYWYLIQWKDGFHIWFPVY